MRKKGRKRKRKEAKAKESARKREGGNRRTKEKARASEKRAQRERMGAKGYLRLVTSSQFCAPEKDTDQREASKRKRGKRRPAAKAPSQAPRASHPALRAHARCEIPPEHYTQPPAAVPRARRTISRRYARSVISATSCSSASFSHCASGVMMLPSDVEANPHCVATHSFSAG